MRLLYDLSYTQDRSFYSGLYEHGKKIFIELMKKYSDLDITLLLLKDAKMDDFVLKYAKKIEYIDAKLNSKKYYSILEDIASKYDRFILPYQPTKHAFKFKSNVEFYFTIHDLCELHLASVSKINKFEKYYHSGIKDNLKYILKKIFRVSHIWYFYLKNNLGKNIKRSTKIITISNATYDDIINTYGNLSNMVVITSQLKEVIYDEKSNLNYKNYFLFVSSSRYTKNNYAALKALDLIWDNNKDFPYAICVGKLPKKVLSQIKNKDKVLSLDYVSNVDLEYLYENAEALIFPTVCEGFGTPPAEAQKYSTRVLLSDIAPLREFYKNALFFNQLDILDIKDKILKYETINKEDMLNDYKALYNKVSNSIDLTIDFLVK